MQWKYLCFILVIAFVLVGAIPASRDDRDKESLVECTEGEPCRMVSQVPMQNVVVTESQALCTDTSSVLIAANTGRVEAEFVNHSTTVVFVCRGTTPCTVSAGRAYPQYTGRLDDTYMGVYTCITASGSATVYRSEVTR